MKAILTLPHATNKDDCDKWELKLIIAKKTIFLW